MASGYFSSLPRLPAAEVGGGRGGVHVAGTEARSSARFTCSWPPSPPGPRPPMVAYRLRQGPPQCWWQHRRRSDCTRHGWFHFSAPGAEWHKTLAGDRRGLAEGRRVDSKELALRVQEGEDRGKHFGPAQSVVGARHASELGGRDGRSQLGGRGAGVSLADHDEGGDGDPGQRFRWRSDEAVQDE